MSSTNDCLKSPTHHIQEIKYLSEKEEIFHKLNYPEIVISPKKQSNQIEEINESNDQNQQLLLPKSVTKKVLDYESIPNTFISQKKEKIYRETISCFGSENLHLNKTYSRLEKEKIELNKKRKNWEINNQLNESDLEKADKDYMIVNKKKADMECKDSFLSDAKLNKPKFVLEKENQTCNSSYSLKLCNPIKLDEKISSKNKEFGGNWDEVMSNSMKKLPFVQREKDTYREQVLKIKEQYLKTKESKGEVFKFESIVENQSSKKGLMKRNEKKISNKGYSIKKLDSTVLGENDNKSCMNCLFELASGDNLKIFKCGHIMHNKCWLSLKFYQRNDCISCKNAKSNSKKFEKKEGLLKTPIKDTALTNNSSIPQITESFKINASASKESNGN